MNHMDAWTDSAPSAFVLSSGLLGPDPRNPLFAGILDAKRQLQAELASESHAGGSTSVSKVSFYAAICDGDLVTVEAAIAADQGLLGTSYPEDERGFPPLVLAVVFLQISIVDSLLRIHQVDPDIPDSTSVQYTPLMWAVSIKDLPLASLLLEFQADASLSPSGNSINASSLAASSTSEIFDYFKSHNLLASGSAEAEIYPLRTFGDMNDNSTDDVALRIQMLKLADTQNSESLDEEDVVDEEAKLALDTHLAQLPDFDYQNTLPEQFLKFSDLDIPSLLDYIFGLRSDCRAHQHNTKIPAAILFQLIHYSHNKVGSKDLTEFLFECFVTRLRSVTKTKSGVFNMALTNLDQNDKNNYVGTGDIVLLSYWLSVIQFLHFYFTRASLYPRYPKFLQELMNLTQSLVATLSFSINSRLSLLADDCMLNFTSLVDVSSVLYAKDWNIFKSQRKHPNSYDDILNMLYPPTLNDLMKPSPLRYVQVLGALYYVLEIHAVDPLLRLQTFSQVFYYINATIFNILMANSRYCTRIKAIQIRLNISALEDWLRSHDFHAHKPERIGGVIDLLKSTGDIGLAENAILREDKFEETDPHYLSFYYKPLYHIARTQMLPTIELLQWLQIMTGIKKEEALINTINEFDTLNYYQLLKLTTKLYRYEVNEEKVPKSLIQLLKRLVSEQGENLVSRTKLHYMTQSTFLLKEVYIYLNPNHIFGVALPNVNELIMNYGAGIGGVKRLRAKKYQPSLPITIIDDIDILLTKNKNDMVGGSYDYDDSNTEKNVTEPLEIGKPGPTDPNERKRSFKGDELFKQMQPPLSLAHKEWGTEDIESNPW